MHRFGLSLGLLSFLSEAEKLILLNGLAWVGWFSKLELRDFIHQFGLAVGLLVFLSYLHAVSKIWVG